MIQTYFILNRRDTIFNNYYSDYYKSVCPLPTYNIDPVLYDNNDAQLGRWHVVMYTSLAPNIPDILCLCVQAISWDSRTRHTCTRMCTMIQ
jgi:hypothetical protein